MPTPSTRERGRPALALGVLGLFLLAAPIAASAQSGAELGRPAPGFERHPPPLGALHLGVGQSMGGPGGAATVVAGWSPGPWLTFGLGAGLNAVGVQGLVSAAVYLPHERDRTVGLELGASVGPHASNACGLDLHGSRRCPAWKWDTAYWAHGALVGRWRMGESWWYRLQLGYTRLLNVDHARCTSIPDGETCDADPRAENGDNPFVLGNPFIAVEFAYTFDL